jgi:hypothetical protein
MPYEKQRSSFFALGGRFASFCPTAKLWRGVAGSVDMQLSQFYETSFITIESHLLYVVVFSWCSVGAGCSQLLSDMQAFKVLEFSKIIRNLSGIS